MAFLASLTNRIFLASAVLATLSIGGALYFVNGRVSQEVEIELQRDVTEAAELLQQQRTNVFDTYSRIAQLIADLPRFKAVVELADVPTIEPIAREYREKSGADVLIVTNRAGMVLAYAGDTAVDAARIGTSPAVTKARDGRIGLDFWPHGAGVLQVVTVPIAVGPDPLDVLGTLTMGYLLDDRRAQDFKTITGTDLAFAFGGEILASTLGGDARAELTSIARGSAMPRVSAGGNEYDTRVMRLPPPGEGVDGGTVPDAIILRSRTERMHTVSAIRTALAGLALITIVVAVGISYAVARTITRPLGAITDHMRQVAATGDLTGKVELGRTGGWGDEDAQLLASTFNRLTESVARFQREAAQRERLSSLGRMSTVIAHEIRNPLMIIKGALRTLTRAGVTPDDVRDAANDIDEETERLNRVVHEVLDFARPIRFEAAPTDINAVARAAAAAVTQAESGPPVAVILDQAAQALDTDGERLRTVLVNLLANARQAVQAREKRDGAPPPGAHGTEAPVAIVTSRAGDRRVGITIVDRGVGIAADDLPRVFDPYFTTRRGGTGLGLPIAKNIVEALGGTITIASTAGHSTDIHIELGDAPPPPRT